MSAVTAHALTWTESGLVPDTMVRAGIRRLLDRRRNEIRSGDVEHASRVTNRFVERMNDSPIALVPESANEQHYEVPAAFFAEVLGARRKYSCCYWPQHVTGLDEAETAALAMTAERAGIGSGMQVLDLGCGWGALSLWLAEHYPDTRVTSVSNSASQRDYILSVARDRGLDNIAAQVCDMNDFAAPAGTYDRIVSLEMFEHMRNWGILFAKIDRWLKPDGLFFLHIFVHRTTPYEYVDRGDSDWMSRYFFAGGMMPSAALPLRFARHLAIDRRWAWNGKHYAKTCNAWLARMDSRKAAIIPILCDTYGAAEADRWWIRWRMFFMACAELFATGSGDEWFVGHYRFGKRGE